MISEFNMSLECPTFTMSLCLIESVTPYSLYVQKRPKKDTIKLLECFYRIFY